MSGAASQRWAQESALSECDQRWLEQYLAHAGAVAGTVHRAAPGGLRLTAAHHIRPHLQAVVAWVPEGKGMAGQAMVTRQPVSTCNLKDDPSSTVRPGARAVDAAAAVAIPLSPSLEGSVQAVVGLAFSDRRDLPAQDIERWTGQALTLIENSISAAETR